MATGVDTEKCLALMAFEKVGGMRKRLLGTLIPGWKLMVLALVLVVAAGCTNNTRSGAKKNTARKMGSASEDKYWLSAKSTVYKALPELLAQHEAELKKGLMHDKLMRGDGAKKEIALTFDDGPHPKFTPKLLAILKRYDVKATFFLVGEMAEKYPKLVRDEAAAGHSIGNHTYHHVCLTKIPEGYIATEIDACGNVLRKITHKKVKLFRPPGGDYNDQVAETVEALDYTLILWTDDPADYANPGSKVIEGRLLDKANNGGIILIHDGVEQTVKALPYVIETLKKRGYQFVTIDEMLRDRRNQISVSKPWRKHTA